MKKIIFKTDVIKGTRQFDKDSIIEGTLLYVGETHDLDRYPHSCPYLVFELKDGSIESFLLGAEVSVLGEDGISTVLTAKAPKQGNVAYGLFEKYLISTTNLQPISADARFFAVRYDEQTEIGSRIRTALKAFLDAVKDINQEQYLMREIQVFENTYIPEHKETYEEQEANRQRQAEAVREAKEYEKSMEWYEKEGVPRPDLQR